MTTSTTNRKLEPHHVKSLLSRDVTSILSNCLHHFEDVEQKIEESYFDVDGIIAGRASREQQASIRRSTAVKARPVITPSRQATADALFLRVPKRGNFIPAFA